MEKHYVLDIQYAGKAFGQLHMLTPWAASQLQQARELFPTEQGYDLKINQVKEHRIVYQSGSHGISVLGDSLVLEPCPINSEV